MPQGPTTQSPCSSLSSALLYILNNATIPGSKPLPLDANSISVFSNNDNNNDINATNHNVLFVNWSHLLPLSFESSAATPLTTATSVYCYATPVLIVLGMLGNALSLKVFLSRTMRRLEASVYLSALSVSDLAALFCYVLVDWLRRGAPYLGSEVLRSVTVFEIQGICQMQMYLSYVTRFLSAWIIVTFTMERYIAVCHPVKRRGMIFGSRSSVKILLVLLVISFVLMVYKPILTGRYDHRVRDNSSIGRCSRTPYHPMLSFILDSIFAVSITLIPFLVITVLNTLIILRLYRRHRRLRTHVVTEESVVRMEFTVIFLVISFVFIAVNLPYFVFWCYRFLKSFYNTEVSNVKWAAESESLYGLIRIVFYLNYSINFFLYSISGACFRKQLKMMFVFRKRKQNAESYVACSRVNNHSNNSDATKANSVHNDDRSWV